MGFRGESTNKVDAKGRVSVPAGFRRVLEEGDPNWAEGLTPNLTIVYGGKSQRHLEVYTEIAMADVEARIARMQRGSVPRRTLERMFQGQSLPTSIDGNGRIIIPQQLREKIGLTDEAYFTGAGETFQIWHPAVMAARDAALQDSLDDEYGEDFDPLMLLDEAPVSPPVERAQ